MSPPLEEVPPEGHAEMPDDSEGDATTVSEPDGGSNGDTPVEEDEGTASEEASQAAIHSSLSQLGFVGFDGGGADNTTAGFMVPPETRRRFRREIYVGVSDD